MSEKDKANILAIEEGLIKILNFCEDFTNAQDFFNDIRTFDAVLMNFVVIGESVSRISEDYKAKNTSIDWQKIKDFRNVVAHDYFGIDPEDVWQIIQNHVPKLQIEINNILQIE